MSSLALSEAIQRYLIPWTGLDWPLCWEEVFERRGELVVEVGFGSGSFLEGLAGRHPKVNFVGIERAWGSVQRLFKRLEAVGLENVYAVQGDAAFILEWLFAPDSVAQMYVNFPDPWHKERHHSRRLIQPGFVRLIAERLVVGGEVTIATDQADYAAWIAGVLEGQSVLAPVLGSTWVPELADRRPTRYEQKALSAGAPIHYFVWRREGCSPLASAVLKVGTMPNIILEGACDREELLADFTARAWKETHRGVGVIVKLGEVYRQVEAGHRLVAVLVKEGEFAQNFGILVLCRSDGRLLIKLSPMGYPRPTWGVKRAVWRVSQVIREACPALRVVSTTVVAEEVRGER